VRRRSLGASISKPCRSTARAGFGYAWYATGDHVWRVAPAPPGVSDTITLPSAAGITTGVGSVWVTDVAGSVLRINPVTDTITNQIHVHRGLAGIGIGEGRVWVAIDAGS
jgi:hypothetical protein